MVISKIIFLVFVLAVHGGVVPELNNQYRLQIFESKVNKSIECVRETLETGIPSLHLPSFNPLVIKDFHSNLDDFNLTNISGEVTLKNGIVNDIVLFVMDKIRNNFTLIPPTFDVGFGLHYAQISADGDYKINVTIDDKRIWGEGHILSAVKNLSVNGNVKAVVTKESVVIEEFKAPITIEDYNFNITGLYGDEEYSKELSEKISKLAPDYINKHPEIFTNYIAPILIKLYNGLVNDNIGIGIIKEMTQKCIIDVIFPPKL